MALKYSIIALKIFMCLVLIILIGYAFYYCYQQRSDKIKRASKRAKKSMTAWAADLYQRMRFSGQFKTLPLKRSKAVVRTNTAVPTMTAHRLQLPPGSIAANNRTIGSPPVRTEERRTSMNRSSRAQSDSSIVKIWGSKKAGEAYDGVIKCAQHSMLGFLKLGIFYEPSTEEIDIELIEVNVVDFLSLYLSSLAGFDANKMARDTCVLCRGKELLLPSQSTGYHVRGYIYPSAEPILKQPLQNVAQTLNPLHTPRNRIKLTNFMYNVLFFKIYAETPRHLAPVLIGYASYALIYQCAQRLSVRRIAIQPAPPTLDLTTYERIGEMKFQIRYAPSIGALSIRILSVTLPSESGKKMEGKKMTINMDVYVNGDFRFVWEFPEKTITKNSATFLELVNCTINRDEYNKTDIVMRVQRGRARAHVIGYVHIGKNATGKYHTNQVFDLLDEEELALFKDKPEVWNFKPAESQRGH